MSSTESRYRLTLRITIERETLYKDANQEQWMPTNDRLEVAEVRDLGLMSFPQMASALARVHEGVTSAVDCGVSLPVRE